MTKRAHLHHLTQQLGRYLKWQRACGTDAFVPAGDEVRQVLEERKKALQEREVEALKAGMAEPEQRPQTGQPSQAQTPSPSPQPQPPQQAQQSRSPFAQDEKKKTPRRESARRITASTPLWKKHRAIHELDQERRQKAASAAEERAGRSAAHYMADEVPENPETPAEKMAFLRNYLGNCRRCPLHEGRTTVVFGEGNPRARLMFVGEGPGEKEDEAGQPFVGPSGQLLTKMIGAMGLSRDEVYITNVVKCRPPQNRNPAPLEIKECAPFLRKQIEVIEPEVIVTVGRFATNTLLDSDEALGKLRGRWHSYLGVAVMPTYHPAYLLRNEGDRELRGKAWSDLQMVMEKLNLREDK